MDVELIGIKDDCGKLQRSTRRSIVGYKDSFERPILGWTGVGVNVLTGSNRVRK